MTVEGLPSHFQLKILIFNNLNGIQGLLQNLWYGSACLNEAVELHQFSVIQKN